MRKVLVGILLICGVSFASNTTKVNLKGKAKIKYLETIDVDTERTLVLRGEVNAYVINALTEQFHQKIEEDSNKDVYLVIDTPGGSIIDGMKFINLMKAADKKFGIKTICIVEDQAYSMGAVIMAFCDKTYMTKFASLMFHEAAYGVRGMEYHVTKRHKFITEQLDIFRKDISKQLGISVKDYQKHIEYLETWWTSEKASQYGLIDGILDYFYYRP